LSAMLFMRLFAGKIRDVFWVAAIPGVVCVLLVWFGVKEVRRATHPNTSSQTVARSQRFPRGRLLLILAAVGLFSLGNSSDLFLILRAQNLGMGAWTAPALGLLFNVVYAALSWPAGKLSDRVPRRWLVVAGYLVYAVVYAGFAWLKAPQMVWFLFAIYGTYYSLTEGVMKAWVADLAPADSRAWAFGVLNWVVGVAAFPASFLAGWIWQRFSPAAPFAVSSVLSFTAAVLLLFA
jgi:predicted MFS family arabinose efflux permease